MYFDVSTPTQCFLCSQQWADCSTQSFAGSSALGIFDARLGESKPSFRASVVVVRREKILRLRYSTASLLRPEYHLQEFKIKY